MAESEKNQYLQTVAQQYKSISSHDLDYHIQKQHKFVTIEILNWDTAVWAANRFKQLHRPHVWEEMQKACGASTVESYAQAIMDSAQLSKRYADFAVTLESIRHGTVDKDLKLHGFEVSQSAKELYQSWLNAQ